MKSSIEIKAVFDYRGETFAPSVTLDLDRQLERYGQLPDFHHLLATENHIDSYSYQYEVLASCELEFSNASGLATEFVSDGVFDVLGFQLKWHEQKAMVCLKGIASQYMAVEDLEQEPDLKLALLAAYDAGRKNL